MITAGIIDRDYRYIEHVKELYERSFPKKERRPFEFLLEMANCTLYYMEVNNRFAAFSAVYRLQDIRHIVYMAVEEKLQKKGIGSTMLSYMKEIHEGKRIIVDVEEPLDTASNKDERDNRISFYLDNGFKFTDVRFVWNEENYILLSFGGEITEDEHNDFWDRVFTELQEEDA